MNNGNFDTAINTYRNILSENANVESAKFGLTVLVPLYYLLNNGIELASSHLESLVDNEQSQHYELVKNPIVKSNTLLVDIEKKQETILTSLNTYFNQYSNLLEEAKREPNSDLQQNEADLNTIEAKLQKVFKIVAEYIAFLQSDLESKKTDLSDCQKNMLSLSTILESKDCDIQTNWKGDKWVQSTCTTLMNELPSIKAIQSTQEFFHNY